MEYTHDEGGNQQGLVYRGSRKAPNVAIAKLIKPKRDGDHHKEQRQLDNDREHKHKFVNTTDSY